MPDATDDTESRRAVQDVAISIAVVAAWFVVAAVVAALIWVNVTPIPEFTRTSDNGSMGEEQLALQFSASGWYLVIGAVGGLISGLMLLMLRRRSPVIVVILVAAGATLATFLMLLLGLAWGPPDPNKALAVAKLGAKVPVRLKPDVKAVYYVWPAAAMIGAAIAIWIQDLLENRRRYNEPVPFVPPSPGRVPL